MAQSNLFQKCEMCQGVTSHELWYPVEVMKFYCKHCHNFWVMKITWERSSPVQPQTVVSKFLWLLHVVERVFKFNVGFEVLFDSNSCSLVPVFKMERYHKKNNSNSYAENKQCSSKDTLLAEQVPRLQVWSRPARLEQEQIPELRACWNILIHQPSAVLLHRVASRRV